jgi:hypothetical protein
MAFFYLELVLTRRGRQAGEGLGRAGEQGLGRGARMGERAWTTSSYGGARAELRRRRTAAQGMVDGELGNGEGARERGKARGGREGRGSAFYRERGERESRRGERESSRPSMTVINGAIRERTWGRREREGRGGFWCWI